MKKRLTAWLLCAGLTLSCLPGAQAAFTDISDPDVALAAATLQGLGVVDGTGGNAFSPDETLDRAQVCAMAVKAMGLTDLVNGASRKTFFSDVSPAAWYNGFINLAYERGVINGYGNGTFGPNDPITYGQLATILLRMLGYTTAEVGSVWPMDYTSFAEELGLSEGLSLDPMGTVTRAQAAILFANAMQTAVNGSTKPYYQSIQGVASTTEGILLDTDASQGESGGLLLFYGLDGSGGSEYYTQKRPQSESLEGSVGILLFNSGGEVVGFVPESRTYLDVTVASATASTLKGQSGQSWRIPAGATVIADGEVYSYRTSGYLQLNAKAGQTVRLFYDESGAISHLYLGGGSAAAQIAAVASSSAAESSLARTLGLSGSSYSITKNGAAADADALARYDVGYYDSAAGTLRVSDWRVSGCLSSASPSLTAASTLTLSGHTFEVLECAWDTLGEFSLGSRVTLLLTDDCKVAAVYAAGELAADMVGILSTDGRSVTLLGSGVTLSAQTMNHSASVRGGLVRVSAYSATSLTCTAVESQSAALDVAAGTLGGRRLAPGLSVCEWGGSGYVYDLEGEQGSFSQGLSALEETAALSASRVSWYHLNTAGQVDALLLKDVTGNFYRYGTLTLYTGSSGVSTGGGDLSGYNDAAALQNSAGTSSKYLSGRTGSLSGYVGIALGSSATGSTYIASSLQLTSLGSAEASDFFLREGKWYVTLSGQEYPVADGVEICLPSAGTWLGGEEGLVNVLGDGYRLTLYTDRSPGGKIRLITAS